MAGKPGKARLVLLGAVAAMAVVAVTAGAIAQLSGRHREPPPVAQMQPAAPPQTRAQLTTRSAAVASDGHLTIRLVGGLEK